jgi:hypothetical protein
MSLDRITMSKDTLSHKTQNLFIQFYYDPLLKSLDLLPILLNNNVKIPLQ